MAQEVTEAQLTFPMEAIAAFCRRWKITELAVFGSAIRPDFSPTSDVDILITFAPDAKWGLVAYMQMEQELEELIGRKVDLVTRRAVEQSANWIRRRAILSTARILYGA